MTDAPTSMAIVVQQQNKMFDRLLDRNERQLRLEKSKLYRQMLDNQIILNEQYRRKQQEAEIARTTPHLRQGQGHPPSKRAQSYEHELEESRRRPVNKIRLPALEDKQTHYEGHSNFISPRDAPTIRKAPPTRHKKTVDSRLSSEEDSESEDIEDILSELKTLSKELANAKQRKRRKLSKFDGNTRRGQHKNRQERHERTMNIDNTKVSRADATRPSRNRDRLGTETNSTRNGGLVVKTEPDSNPQQANNSAAIRWEEQRDKFIQILKKVRNRGESLILKLNKYPKQ